MSEIKLINVRPREANMLQHESVFGWDSCVDTLIDENRERERERNGFHKFVVS